MNRVLQISGTTLTHPIQQGQGPRIPSSRTTGSEQVTDNPNLEAGTAKAGTAAVRPKPHALAEPNTLVRGRGDANTVPKSRDDVIMDETSTGEPGTRLP